MRNYDGEECVKCGNNLRNKKTHNCVICYPAKTGKNGRNYIAENMEFVNKKRDVLYKLEIKKKWVIFMKILGNSIKLVLNPENKDQKIFEIKSPSDFQSFMSVLYTVCKNEKGATVEIKKCKS